MKLFELFQNYYPYNRLDDKHYKFDTDQGLRYLVYFNELYIPINGDWQLQKVLATGFALVDDAGEPTDKIQHTGNAITVFSTVGKIIQEHLNKEPVDRLAFGAKLIEPSRVKLYQTFIKYLPKFLPGWKLELSSDKIDPGLRVWILKKNNN